MTPNAAETERRRVRGTRGTESRNGAASAAEAARRISTDCPPAIAARALFHAADHRSEGVDRSLTNYYLIEIAPPVSSVARCVRHRCRRRNANGPSGPRKQRTAIHGIRSRRDERNETCGQMSRDRPCCDLSDGLCNNNRGAPWRRRPTKSHRRSGAKPEGVLWPSDAGASVCL